MEFYDDDDDDCSVDEGGVNDGAAENTERSW